MNMKNKNLLHRSTGQPLKGYKQKIREHSNKQFFVFEPARPVFAPNGWLKDSMGVATWAV